MLFLHQLILIQKQHRKKISAVVTLISASAYFVTYFVLVSITTVSAVL